MLCEMEILYIFFFVFEGRSAFGATIILLVDLNLRDRAEVSKGKGIDEEEAAREPDAQNTVSQGASEKSRACTSLNTAIAVQTVIT